MPNTFELQGHRGARGLKPENTLPSFEVALDIGVSTIETDLHLTRDEVVVLAHEPHLSKHLFKPLPGITIWLTEPLLRSVVLAEIRGYRADSNPDRSRFPQQTNNVTPLSRLYGLNHELDPYALPTLADLFAFFEAYSGEMGQRAGKSEAQRHRARQVRFDLELKRVPFHPEYFDDGFDGSSAALLENQVLAEVRKAKVVERTTVRSFDHRCVRLLLDQEPGLTGAALVEGTAPADPVAVAQAAKAKLYCPDYHFLDRAQVERLHEAGIRVVPWTVNHARQWDQLLEWGVDGLTTDYPDQLAADLHHRGIGF